MNPVDTVFVLFSALLVWIMTAGLSLFYGGLTRSKSMLNTMMMVILPLGFGTVIWYLFGYSLAFNGNGAFIGNLKDFAFANVSLTQSTHDLTIPDAVFAIFQGMFPLITIGIIAGAVVDRINFKAFGLFTIIWMLVVYVPLAHMVWGGGLIQKLGVLDFAGGDVVHISSGVSALVLAIVIGHRKDMLPPTVKNVPAVVAGAALLWLGWFGFNAGSALAINEAAIQALLNTILAGALGFTLWNLLDYLKNKTISLSGSFTGALTGLVLITPGAGLIKSNATFITILIGTPILFFAINGLKHHFGYDDALDAFGAHGLGGILGGLFTGIFADKGLSGTEGLIHGNIGIMGTQLAGITIAIIWAAIGTFIIIKLIGYFIPLRVDPNATDSRDFVEHAESSFDFNN
ncbi:ammonium transporter [Weissella viridescens]|uniref:ammonium transporter n=1 Tax=Weissella viridescens TaxID=1629 RepID=UPI001D06F957|nr:ammonium transporter [Weissella viridescens]MCB6840021.1 ammonium transporter [Weissella viridescens]MCB6846745.1 ammonium transporter [Weissella viridescens]